MPLDCIELDDLIQKLEKEEPDRRTKEHKSWLESINKLYTEYNRLVKFKCYKMLK